MRHRLSRLRLRQKPAHSRSMQRNIVTSLLLYEAIRTTKKRAQVVRPIVEHLITIAKTKQPHVAIRAINAVVHHKNACRKTMEVLKDRYSTRSSGFTRLVPLGSRAGDGAKVVRLELVDGTAGGGDRGVREKTTKSTKSAKSAKKTAKNTSPSPSL